MAIEINGNITRRYYHTFTADDGNSYRWEIHQDGYDSTTDGTEVLSGSTRTHCVTRWGGVSDDEFSPILGSETTISFFEDDDDPVVAALIQNVASSEEQFAIVIKDANPGMDDVKWVGFVDYEDVSRPEDGLVSLSITARDGLGRLENKYYLQSTATGALYEGRATLTSIIAALLQQIGWGIDFYVATELYPAPYSGDEPLGVSDNPLDSLYVERLLFTAIVEGETDVWGRKIPENAPIKSIEVLKAILERFCLRIFQADGAWHLYQVNQYYTTTETTAPDLDTASERAQKFRRWRYDSSGAAKAIDPAVPEINTEVFTHAVTISNDTVKRSVANASLAKSYSAAQVTYNHGAIRLIRQPGFDSTKAQPRGYVGYADSDQWITNDELKSTPVQLGEDAIKDAGWKVLDIDATDWTTKTGYSSVFGGWANATGTGVGTVDEAIGDYKVYQTTKATIPSGTNLRSVLRAFLINQSNSAFIHGDFNYALPIQIKINSATPKYWTKGVAADSWSTTPNWVMMENPTPGQGIINFSHDLPITDVAGTITYSIGGPFDASEYNDQNDDRYDDISAVICDHADIVVVLDDGSYNADATSVINYIDRDVPKIKVVNTKLGDGPTNLNLGSLSFDSAGLKATGTWAEGASAAASYPTDSLNELQSRVILRGTNEPRNKHQAQYFDAGQILWPLYSIRRSSTNYIAWDIDHDWQAAVTAGTWGEVKQFGFTDDLVSGIDSGAGSANWNSSYDRSGYLLSRLSKAFFSDTARRITRTTATIPAGNGTSTISVEQIPDALLDEGDYINIIAPDLSFYTVRIAATQTPGATTLAIDDPDNEGSNFNFPAAVPYPASIFMADKTVMTLARLGEQGFAVTVLGSNIGVIDEDIVSPTTRTSLTVRNWAISMKTGDKVQIQQSDDDGTYVEVTLTQNAPKGSTTIYFSSVTLQVAQDGLIKPTGSVNRADFQVTAEAITSYLGNPGEVIATLSADSTWDGTRTTLPCSAGTSVALKANDPILIYTQLGRVVKGFVNADTASGATSIVLTAGTGNLTTFAKSGDKVVPGSLTGLRIDMDGIEVRADELRSSNYSNTPGSENGWLIDGGGNAEFNSVTVRGNIQVGAGSDVGWSYVSGATKPEDNATVGATWGINITSQPSDSALLNANQIWNDISGTGKPEDDATVGADWDVNLTQKPDGASVLKDMPGTGLNITSSYLGYYNSGWKTFMDANGNFYLGGTGGKLQWAAASNTLTIAGSITAESGYIGTSASGFTINSSYFANGKTSLTDANSGVYVGTDGISLGASSVFKVTSDGALTATSATISGSITAESGYIGTSVSGFSINSSYFSNGKASLTDANAGVYVGTDGISLGASSAFKVTSAGVLTATSATISGSVTATTFTATTAGSIANLNITGDLTMNGYAGASWAAAKITTGGDIYANNAYAESLTLSETGLTIYSSTAGPASGTLAYANGVFTVDGDDVISEGSIGNGLSYASFTLNTDSLYISGTGGYGGDTGLAQIRLGDGTRVWVKCEDVT